MLPRRNRQAICVEPRTGRILWTIPVRGLNLSWPPVTEDYIVFTGVGETRSGTFDEKKETLPTCYRITPTEAEKVWTLPFKACSDGSALIYKGWVIPVRVPNHYAVKLETGEEQTEVNLGPVYGPAAGDGFLFGGASDTDAGRIWKISPDGRTFENVSPKENRKLFSHGGFNSPVYVGGRLYLRGLTSIKCIDFRKTPETEKAEPMPAKAAARDGPGLVKQLASPYYTYREEAIEALGRLPVTQRVALLPELTKMVQGDSWQSARCAARVLTMMGEAAKPAAPEVKRAGSEALAKKLPGNLELFSATLAAIAPDQATEAALAVAKLLESDAFLDVSLGCHVLEEMGGGGRAGVPALIKVCASQDPERVIYRRRDEHEFHECRRIEHGVVLRRHLCRIPCG